MPRNSQEQVSGTRQELQGDSQERLLSSCQEQLVFHSQERLSRARQGTPQGGGAGGPGARDICQRPGRPIPSPRSGSPLLPRGFGVGLGWVWVPFPPACRFGVGLGPLPPRLWGLGGCGLPSIRPVGLGPLLWMKNLWRRAPGPEMETLPGVGRAPAGPGPGKYMYIYINGCVYFVVLHTSVPKTHPRKFLLNSKVDKS